MFVISKIDTAPMLDLSGDSRFCIDPSTGTYGIYIYKLNGPNDPNVDKGLYDDYLATPTSPPRQFHRDVRTSFLHDPNNPTNSKYNNYYTLLIFGNQEYHKDFGSTENIGTHNSALFTGRLNDTTIHESLHGIGLYHAFLIPGEKIQDPEQKFVFGRTYTDNFMSNTRSNTVPRRSSWRWQWQIVTTNL